MRNWRPGRDPAYAAQNEGNTFMKKLIAAALLATALPAIAQPLPRAAPESLGFSTERLNRIRTTMEADIARGQLPGAVVAVARRGQLAYYEAFGRLDGAGGGAAPMPLDAIFPIASMTKPMTGVALMTLLEEGRLSIGDPISRFFPSLGDRRVAVDGNPENTVPATRPITLTDLARHTSGITYGGRGTTALHRMYPASSGSSSTEFTPQRFIERLAGLPLLHQPGSTWDYSLSIDVLGLVVEQQTEQRLGEAMAARIFRPLRMPDTGFTVTDPARYATALPLDPGTRQPQGVRMGLTAPMFDCGGGCAVSTAGDYIRFAQMLLNGGVLDGQRILSRASVAEMTRDHMHAGIQNNITGTEGNMVNWGFGLTMAVRREGGSALLGNPGMFSWNGAYGTAMWVDPQAELAVVFMAATPGLLRQYYRRVINALVYGAMTD